jgi:hypothetical protein
MTRSQMVLVCQSADTRLAGEDEDHTGTMKLSEKEMSRILEHGRHFPFLTPKERDEGGDGHWRTRMWETSAIEICETTRDLGFPVSKDKDLVRSVRDTTEDHRINLVISPEILSFCRRKIEEWDQKEETDLCTRAVQEVVNQWSPGRNTGDLTQTEQADSFEGHLLSRKLGWCPMKNQLVVRCLGGAEGPLDRQEKVGRGKRWEATSMPL